MKCTKTVVPYMAYAAPAKLPPQQWEVEAALRSEVVALRLRVVDLERMLDDAIDDLVACLETQ